MVDGTENPLEAKTGFEVTDLGAQNIEKASLGEGGGLAGSVYNSIKDGIDGDWAGAGAEFVGAGLDALGIAMNPLGGLASAGVGWLIEHVGFLKEPLDLLAGDPAAVSSYAQTWTNIADELRRTAKEFHNARQNISGSTGQAIADYQTVVNDYVAAVEAAASHADKASSAINTSGVVVAVTRGIVRDNISEWVVDRAFKWIAASALTPFTGGASQAAFATDSVISGARLSVQNAGRLRKVAGKLDEFASGAARSGGAFGRASRAMDDVATGGTKAAKSAKAARGADDTSTIAGRVAKYEDDVKEFPGMAAKAPKKLADQRRAAGKNISSKKAPKGTKQDRAKAHDQVRKQEQKAIRQQTEAAAKHLTDESDKLPTARAQAWQQEVRLPTKAGQKIGDSPGARAFAEDDRIKAAKEAMVQASNYQERADTARADSEQRREKWRKEGTLDD